MDSPKLAPFEILEHPADVGFLARGGTLEELFANAALAVMTLACDPENVRETERREIDVTGNDPETLLFAWLAEILAIADAESLVFRRMDAVEVSEARARGIAHGETYDRERHRAGVAIKAVTYHQFAIERTAEGFQARVFVDL